MTPPAVAAPRGAGVAAGSVVASTCPSCGAPLDFDEGSNAVRCAHCGSMLLVTGRRSVLSYVIRPRVTPPEARALAGFTRAAGAPPLRAGAPALLFVPYYRLTAEEVYWRRDPLPPAHAAHVPQVDDVSEPLLRVVASVAARERSEDRTVSLASRVIERSFIACDAGELASWSLGVRPGVLRLDLFRREELAQQGTILRPTLAADVARERALEPLEELGAIQREVLRCVLSLVYFPLWTVATGAGASERLTVVDAVSGAVVARDADAAPLAALASGGDAQERVLGFRPLTCPNCAWDLPVRPADVVFHCASCGESWELVGDELEPIASDVVVHGGPSHGARAASSYLPVWRLDGAVTVAGKGSLPQRLYAPAFHWRIARALCDLGACLVRVAPAEPQVQGAKTLPLLGCSLDRSDAPTMARLVGLRVLLENTVARLAAGLGRGVPVVEIAEPRLRLLWLPFAGDAYSLREPFSGYALPRRDVEAALTAGGA